MCGICGIVAGPRAPRRPTAETVLRMRDAMAHRGPDGAGIYVGDGVALGHRRLSIVDVAHGQQPMASDDGRAHLVYNGEVFNHADLRAELEARGHRYHTRCDTETVLRLWEAEGLRAPRRLRGMFAFAVWDAARRELVLVRDRFGVKPLYYALDADGTLSFASEIKGLVAAGAVRPALNRLALPDLLANHAPSGEETLFEGVRRLPAGHLLVWRDGAVRIERYWDLVGPDASRPEIAGSDDDLVAEYGERLREAVRLRLMSDVPLGVFLSGGIDSAAITALTAQLVDAPVRTFSVAFAEREANELAWARMVARRYRTEHHEVLLDPAEFFSLLRGLVWHEDEPLAHPSSVALHAVSRLAARHVKVVLTGEGSDETLAGYGRYHRTVLNARLGRWYEALVPAPARGLVRRALEALPASSAVRRKLSRTFLTRPAELDALYFENFAVFARDRQASLLSPALREELAGVDPYAAHRAALARVGDGPLLERLLYVDTKTYLHELLMKQDQMSMAASIESRVPFLDHPLVEFATALPERMKLRGATTKWVLREAMKPHLPAEILRRGKMGFPVPLAGWLRGAFRPLVDDLVLGERARARGLFDAGAVRRLAAEHAGGAHDHAQRLWALMNLELWHRLFVDGEPVEEARPRAAADGQRAAVA